VADLLLRRFAVFHATLVGRAGDFDVGKWVGQNLTDLISIE
jgi:hypothetical protein